MLVVWVVAAGAVVEAAVFVEVDLSFVVDIALAVVKPVELVEQESELNQEALELGTEL